MLKDLIDSLSPVEKRMISARLESKKIHLEVYKTILKHNCGKNHDFKAHIGSRSYFPILTTVKNQLYNMILEILRENNKENSMEIEITKELGNIEVLFSKKLLNQALKKLHKLKSFCILNERLGYLLEVINLELFILFESSNGQEFEQVLNRIYLELRESNSLFQEQFLYKLTYLRAINLIDNRTELVKPIHLNPEKKRKLKLDSSQYYYHHTRLIWALELKRYDLSKESADLLIEMVNKFPNELQKNKRQYIDVLFACVMANIYVSNFDLAEKFLNDIEQTEAQSGHVKIRRDERCLYGRILNKIHKGKFRELSEEKNLMRKSQNFNPIFVQRMCLLLCFAAIRENDLREAKKWCNEILFLKKKEIHVENYKKVMYAELYIYLKQDDLNLFEKQINSAHRRLAKIEGAGSDAMWFHDLLVNPQALKLLEDKLPLLI